MNRNNVTFVILGGTGDLARKKLFPSLFYLFRKGKLTEFDIVGTARQDLSRETYRNIACTNIEQGQDREEFREHIHYVQLDFDRPNNYLDLKKRLLDCADHRLFYLATLPGHFNEITENLAEHGLVNESSKVLYEKPFGEDLRSAQELNDSISKVFPEDKIYRIDHYLDKELVGMLSILRFSNTIFDPLLKSEFVDHVQIIASENFGVEERGEFYDRYGAIKDFFQSHLLQLLSLIGMSPPERFDANSIRDEKVKALKEVNILDSIVGQYRGYREEQGVRSDSTTETLIATKVELNTGRWAGVPFYLLSGKNLPKKYSQIYVQFRNRTTIMPAESDGLAPNTLVVSIDPDKGIYLTINTKVPGELRTERARMEFCHTCHHGPNTPDAYENLLAQAIAGDQRSFVRYDEIEEQ